jgi:indolepyruvate ferredoxin oxidoreductase
LRGTALDPFGRSAERCTERKLINDYEARMRGLASGLTSDRHGLAVAIASLPERIRGYGHVKTRHLAEAESECVKLMAEWASPAAITRKAAE